eukprot:250748_1
MSLLSKRTAEEAKLDEPPKKRHKKNQNYYEIFGDDAKVEIEIRRDELNKRRHTFLHSKDFQSLILWMLGDTISPNWVFIKHRPLIEKVIVVQIDNLTETMIKSLRAHHTAHTNVNDNCHSFPFFNTNTYCPLQLDIPKFDKTTKHQPFKKLTVVAIDKIKGLSSNKNTRFAKKKKKKTPHKSQHIHSPFATKYKHVPELFICTTNELLSNGFPSSHDPQNRFEHFMQLPSHKQNNDTHFRTTDDVDDTSSNDSAVSDVTPPINPTDTIHRLVALDCEMVTTTRGRLELARISIVSEDGQCIYDKLVKPLHEITDYCTKYSGITCAMLENVTTRLSDIQSELCTFLDANTMICGHGLENDLLALEMVHYRCIDTSLLYPASSRHFKNKLRYLASKFLKRNIQQGHDGHNSHEDALAALDLVKLKLQHGPDYGLPKGNHYASIFTVLHEFERKSCLIGPHELFAPISPATPVCAVPTVSNTESVKKSLAKIKEESECGLVWMYLKDEEGVDVMYNNLMHIHLSAPCNAVVTVITGNKDFRELNQLNDKAKAIRDGQIKEAETVAAQIRNANLNAKQYPFWIYVKNDANLIE